MRGITPGITPGFKSRFWCKNGVEKKFSAPATHFHHTTLGIPGKFLHDIMNSGHFLHCIPATLFIIYNYLYLDSTSEL